VVGGGIGGGGKTLSPIGRVSLFRSLRQPKKKPRKTERVVGAGAQGGGPKCFPHPAFLGTWGFGNRGTFENPRGLGGGFFGCNWDGRTKTTLAKMGLRSAAFFSFFGVFQNKRVQIGPEGIGVQRGKKKVKTLPFIGSL